MKQVTRHEIADVTTRLAELGLDQMDLQEAVMQGMFDPRQPHHIYDSKPRCF